MMIISVAQAAAAAVAGSLAFSSGRNMFQTHRLSSSTQQELPDELLVMPTTVSELQNLQRKQLLQLYLNHCTDPTDLSAIEGDWNGLLLKNNGLVRNIMRVCIVTNSPWFVKSGHGGRQTTHSLSPLMVAAAPFSLTIMLESRTDFSNALYNKQNIWKGTAMERKIF